MKKAIVTSGEVYELEKTVKGDTEIILVLIL